MTDEIDQSLGLFGVKGRLTPLIFDHGAALPQKRRDALFTAINNESVVPVLVGAMEALYGASKDAPVPDEVLVVCAQCAYIVCVNNFNNLADRASGVVQACRRELGLTANATTPDPETDPTPMPVPEDPVEQEQPDGEP